MGYHFKIALYLGHVLLGIPIPVVTIKFEKFKEYFVGVPEMFTYPWEKVLNPDRRPAIYENF